MGPAHRREAVPLAKHLGEARINDAFIVAFMLDNLPLNDFVCLHDQGRGIVGRNQIELIGD